MTRGLRRLTAWVAILGLLLQVGLAAAHSAHHFDHVVGHLLPAAHATVELSSDPGHPSPAAPVSPAFDHCAIGLALAASGSFMLPTDGSLPLPRLRETARVEGEPLAIATASRRHLLPPARAPPAVVISV
jgi:hypothetical protein